VKFILQGGFYIKRTLRIIAIACIFLIAFSTTAFAEPAPPVSSAQIVDAYIGTDGNVYITVQVTGYGDPTAFWDSGLVTDYDSQTIGSPIVTGFYYTYNCGEAIIGTHTFKFSVRSYNYPWNTLSASGTFTIS
jgi:hypothetical protein